MLSAKDFGVFSSILLFIYLMISIANSFIIQPLQVTLAHVENEKSYLSFAFFSQILTEIIVALGVSLILWLKLDYLKDFNNFPSNIVILICGFLMHDFNRKLFLAKNMVFYALLIDAITSATQISLLGFVFFFHRIDLSDTIFILGFSYIPSLISTIIILKPSLKFLNQWNVFIRKHYQQGKWLFMTALLQWWSNNLFVVASGAYLGLEALGAFRFVQSLFGVLNILLQTFENYALPQAARLYKSSESLSKKYLKDISLKAALIFGVVLLVLFLFSTQIITFAGGQKYAEYGFIVKGVAVLYFLIFLGYPIRMAIRILVLNRSFFIGYMLSFFFSLFTFNYLLKFWGLWGVIFGIICNQLIILSYWQFELSKKKFILWK